MPAAVSQNGVSPDAPAGNAVSAKFPPVSAGHAPTHEAQSSWSEQSSLRQASEIDVHRMGADSGTEEKNLAQPRHDDERLLGVNLLAGEYVTPEQLAVELGISVRTLHRWHTARQGPPRVVLGRVIFYRRSSVLAWLVSREETPTRRGRRRMIGESLRKRRPPAA